MTEQLEVDTGVVGKIALNDVLVMYNHADRSLGLSGTFLNFTVEVNTNLKKLKDTKVSLTLPPELNGQPYAKILGYVKDTDFGAALAATSPHIETVLNLGSARRRGLVEVSDKAFDVMGLKISDLNVKLEWKTEFMLEARVEWAPERFTHVKLHLQKEGNGWKVLAAKFQLGVNHVDILMEGAQPCLDANGTSLLSGSLRLYDLPAPMTPELYGEASVKLECMLGEIESWVGDFRVGGGQEWNVPGVGMVGPLGEIVASYASESGILSLNADLGRLTVSTEFPVASPSKVSRLTAAQKPGSGDPLDKLLGFAGDTLKILFAKVGVPGIGRAMENVHVSGFLVDMDSSTLTLGGAVSVRDWTISFDVEFLKDATAIDGSARGKFPRGLLRKARSVCRWTTWWISR
jgi:hypothetical protein